MSVHIEAKPVKLPIKFYYRGSLRAKYIAETF